MLKFYFSGARPTRPRSRCEETGLPYDPIPVDTRRGEQHKPDFLAINPNAKLPAIVDGDATVFDSSAILLYLAEKIGKFLPAKTDKARGELLSWMRRPLCRPVGALLQLCAGEASGPTHSILIRKTI